MPTRSSSPLLALAALVAAATAFVYAPALRNGFVNWDDPMLVYQPGALRGLGPGFLAWAFTPRNANWHPLTSFSLALDLRAGGPRPFDFHLSSLLLHALNTGLVVLLAGLLWKKAKEADLDRYDYAAIGGLGAVFGLHPLHVESVAWVSERKDVLYAFWGLLSLLAYGAYASTEASRRRRRWYWACLACLGLSLLSKPMAVGIPATLLILDFYPLRRSRPPLELLLEKAPMFALALCAAAITVLAQSQAGSLEANAAVPFALRVCVALRAIWFYLLKTALPLDLVPYYPLKPVVEGLGYECALYFLGFVGLSTLAIALRKSVPALLAGCAWLLLTLLPVLGLLQAGSQAAADRYMYLALLGPLFLLAAATLRAIRVGWLPPALGALATLGALLTLGSLTTRQIGVWRDSVTLWEAIVQRTPPDVKSFYNLGEAYRDAGSLASAQQAWLAVLRLDPNHSETLNQLGNVEMLNQRPAAAKDYYAAAVRAKPQNAEAHYNFAGALDQLGQTQAAIEEYRLFVEQAPPEYADIVRRVRLRLGLPDPAAPSP